jgi:hypothetical protein
MVKNGCKNKCSSLAGRGSCDDTQHVYARPVHGYDGPRMRVLAWLIRASPSAYSVDTALFLIA